MRVALTLDAEHPDRATCGPGVEERLVALLEDLGVRTTFFLQGRWVEAHPDLARRIVGAGHLIGSHSFYHARLPLLTDEGLAADIDAAERAIREIAGADPRPWFRCPFGEGHEDARVLGVLRAHGYREVGWDVQADDWEPHRTSAAVQATVVDGALDRGDGAVVLLHTWPQTTLAALPGIVGDLLACGVAFVTVEEVLDGRD